MRCRSAAVAAALAVAVAACADDGRHVRSFQSGCATTATGDTTISAVVDDSGPTLTPDRTTAGRVAFVVRNTGRKTHTFTIGVVTTGAPQVIASIASIKPGEVCAASFDLAPRDYVVYCDVDEHSVE